MSTGQLWRLTAIEYGILVFASVALAVVASCTSIVSLFLSTIRLGRCDESWIYSGRVCEEWKPWPSSVGWLIYLLLSVSFALLPAVMVKFAPGASMSGIPELRSFFQGFDAFSTFKPMTLIVKLLGVGLIAASGLYLGLEAPLVHISAIATSILLSHLPISEAKRRDLILASASAGIAVAFSAPLGGVMFAVEAFTPSKDVIWKCFVCSMLAIITLRSIVAPSSSLGGLVLPETGLFRVHFDRIWQGVEIIPFACLGVMGGLYGALVPIIANRTIPYVEKRPLWAVTLVASVTALLCFLNPISRIPATDLVSALFAECKVEDESSLFCMDSRAGGLVYTFILSAVLAPISFTLPVPSGILFPAIVIGSLGGRIVGLVMQSVLERLPVVLSTSFCPDESQHCITPGVYAVVGAACFITGVTRLTISSVVLMMEMTGALTFVLPVMIGAIVAKWVNDICGDTCTIYSSWQSSKSIPALQDYSEIIPDFLATEIMIPIEKCLVIRNSPLEYRSLTNCRYQSVPVLDENDKYMDLVSAKTGNSEPTLVFNPQTSLILILNTISKIGLRVVVLCTDDVFVGLITRSDLVKFLESTKISKTVSTTISADDFEIDSE